MPTFTSEQCCVVMATVSVWQQPNLSALDQFEVIFSVHVFLMASNLYFQGYSLKAVVDVLKNEYGRL